jgi:hypothetical protein
MSENTVLLGRESQEHCYILSSRQATGLNVHDAWSRPGWLWARINRDRQNNLEHLTDL